MRKMVLLFNKMSFGQILHLLSLLKAYLHSSHAHSDAHQDMELSRYIYKFILLSTYCVSNDRPMTFRNGACSLQQILHTIFGLPMVK